MKNKSVGQAVMITRRTSGYPGNETNKSCICGLEDGSRIDCAMRLSNQRLNPVEIGRRQLGASIIGVPNGSLHYVIASPTPTSLRQTWLFFFDDDNDPRISPDQRTQDRTAFLVLLFHHTLICKEPAQKPGLSVGPWKGSPISPRLSPIEYPVGVVYLQNYSNMTMATPESWSNDSRMAPGVEENKHAEAPSGPDRTEMAQSWP
jgi:hypothetical protein